MPITSRIDQTAGVIVCTVKGEPSIEHFGGAVDEYLRHPNFKPGMNALWDLRTAVLENFSPNKSMSRVAQAFGRIRDERGSGYKLALVATSDLEFGLSRQYEALMDRLPFTVQVFRDYDEAWRWVAE